MYIKIYLRSLKYAVCGYLLTLHCLLKTLPSVAGKVGPLEKPPPMFVSKDTNM